MLDCYKTNNFIVSNKDIENLSLIVNSLKYSEDGKVVTLFISDFAVNSGEKLVTDVQLKDLTELEVREYDPKYILRGRDYKLHLEFLRWIPSDLSYEKPSIITTKFIYKVISISDIN